MLRLLALAAALGLLSPWLVTLLADHSQHLAWLLDLASHWQWLHLALLLGCLVLLAPRRPRWLLLAPLLALPWFSVAPKLPAQTGEVRLELRHAARQRGAARPRKNRASLTAARFLRLPAAESALAELRCATSGFETVLHETEARFCLILRGFSSFLLFVHQFLNPRFCRLLSDFNPNLFLMCRLLC